MNEDNFVTGWIHLYRSIEKHWLWKKKPFSELQAWIYLIIKANFEESKFRLGNELIVCKRGELVRSLETLANDWGWNRSKVRRFLMLLKTDTMIDTIVKQKATQITILNYNTYNPMRNNNETKMKRKRNNDETMMTTSKELKNDKNVFLTSSSNSNIIYLDEKNNSKILFDLKNMQSIFKSENEIDNHHFKNMAVDLLTFIRLNYSNISKMKKQLTYLQTIKLLETYKPEIIQEKLIAMENKADPPIYKKYFEVYRTLKNWINYKPK